MGKYLYIGSVVFAIGLLLKFTYYNRKNYFFGYRTYRSLKNISSWNLANKLASVHFIVIGTLNLIEGSVAYVFFPGPLYKRIEIITLLAGVITSIIYIEYKLYLHEKKDNLN